MAFVADPDGIPVGLMEDRTVPAEPARSGRSPCTACQGECPSRAGRRTRSSTTACHLEHRHQVRDAPRHGPRATGRAAGPRYEQGQQRPGRWITASAARATNGATSRSHVEPAGPPVAEPHGQRALARDAVGRRGRAGCWRPGSRRPAHRSRRPASTEAAVTSLGLHERRADRGHQAEEHEDRDLAEPAVAVGRAAAGVEPGGDDAGGADQQQPPRRERGERRARRRRRRAKDASAARPHRAPARPARSRPAAAGRPGRRPCRGRRRCSRSRS